MDFTEYRRQRKVGAERERRRSINSRLVKLRRVLGLENHFTRIQVLLEMLHRLETTVYQHTGVMGLAQVLKRKESTLPPSQENVHEIRRSKALIEQNRRQVERDVLNRIRSIANMGKISDANLMDQLTERFAREGDHPDNTNRPLYHRFKEEIQNKRKPLQSLNTNTMHSNLARPVYHPKQPENNVATREPSYKFIHFWRPWERLEKE